MARTRRREELRQRPAPRTHRARWRVAFALAALALATAGAFSARAPVARYLAQRHFAGAAPLLARGDERGAAAELELALEGNPLQPAARRQLGELHLRRHHLESAFLDLQASTDAFPDDPQGWSDLAEARLQASQPEQAEAALTNAVDAAPGRSDLRLRRAALTCKSAGTRAR